MKSQLNTVTSALIVSFGVLIGFIVSYNLTPEKTSLHTSTVSGSSGDLKCTTSCVIKTND